MSIFQMTSLALIHSAQDHLTSGIMLISPRIIMDKVTPGATGLDGAGLSPTRRNLQKGSMSTVLALIVPTTPLLAEKITVVQRCLLTMG